MNAKKLDRLDPTLLSSNPRATYAAWLKYRDIIVAAFRQHPKTYIYRPTNMMPTSVASKARDALRGKLAFDYPDEVVNNHDLLRWYSEVVFKNDNEHVYIGKPEDIRSILDGSEVKPHEAHIYPTLDFEELSAFNLLLSRGLIAGPVKVKQPPDTSLLEKRTNVELLTQSDGTLVLI